MTSVKIISGTPDPIINFSNKESNEQFRTVLRDGIETFTFFNLNICEREGREAALLALVRAA